MAVTEAVHSALEQAEAGSQPAQGAAGEIRTPVNGPELLSRQKAERKRQKVLAKGIRDGPRMPCDGRTAQSAGDGEHSCRCTGALSYASTLA